MLELKKLSSRSLFMLKNAGEYFFYSSVFNCMLMKCFMLTLIIVMYYIYIVYS